MPDDSNTVVTKPSRLPKPQFGQSRCDKADGTSIITVSTGESFVVDTVDADRVMALSWYAQVRAHTVRFMAHAPGAASPVQIGRFIAGTPAGEVADHINGDASDNRRGNLRNCTIAQNSANSHVRTNKAIQYKGVSQYRLGKFRATARADGKLKHLGTADDAETAARLYDDFARQSFGSFARLNFPLPGELSATREGRQ